MNILYENTFYIKKINMEKYNHEINMEKYKYENSYSFLWKCNFWSFRNK